MFCCARLLYDCCVFMSPLSMARSILPKRERVQAHPKNKRKRDSTATDNGSDSGPAIVVHSAASID